MWDSLTAVQKDFGGPSKVMLTGIENMFMVPDAIANAQKFASQGYDIIILHGTQYGSAMFFTIHYSSAILCPLNFSSRLVSENKFVILL